MDKLEKPLLVLNNDLQEVTEQEFLSGKVAYFATKKPESETENQDCLGVIPISNDTGILVLADGLGGHKGGGQASKVAIESFVQTITPSKLEKFSLRELVLQAIENANTKVIELGIGAGTTLVVAEINKGKARFYSVGDSSVQLVGGKGLLKYKNIEHSPTGFGQVAGMLNEEEALNHEESNILLNALGEEAIGIELSSTVSLSDRDIILLSSDGLTGNIQSGDLLAEITKGDLADRLKKITDMAREQMTKEDSFGSPDDLSVILYRPS